MSLIKWRDEFCLGIPSLDHEHRELIELINSLHEDLYHPHSETSVMEFLGEIFAKVSAHFAHEEKLMRDNDYPEYDDHKRDHERLLDEIRDLMDDYEDGVYVDVEGFAKKLEPWFSEHFKNRDAKLHGCFP
jgi:hemerythrin-like metal-binding protein